MELRYVEKKILALVIAAVVIIAAVGVTLAIVLGGPATSEIRVGFIAGDIHHLPFAVANDESIGGDGSIFDKYDLNVTANGYANGGVIMETGFGQDQIDIAYLGTAPAISKHLNLGKTLLNTSIIAQVNEEGSLLVADETITNATDLIGKRVATPGKATIQYFMLLKYLEDNDINKSDVTIVDVASGLMRTQMEKPLGDPDHLNAFIVWEPIGSDAVAANAGHILATSHDIWAQHPCCVIVVSNSFAANHPDKVSSFIAAHKEAIDWINAAKGNETSNEYQQLLSVGTSFTSKNETVIESALSVVNYNYQLTDTYREMVIEYTEKLIDFEIVEATALQSNGNDYASVEDFAERYVNDEYL